MQHARVNRGGKGVSHWQACEEEMKKKLGEEELTHYNFTAVNDCHFDVVPVVPRELTA